MIGVWVWDTNVVRRVEGTKKRVDVNSPAVTSQKVKTTSDLRHYITRGERASVHPDDFQDDAGFYNDEQSFTIQMIIIFYQILPTVQNSSIFQECAAFDH